MEHEDRPQQLLHNYIYSHRYNMRNWKQIRKQKKKRKKTYKEQEEKEKEKEKKKGGRK